MHNHKLSFHFSSFQTSTISSFQICHATIRAHNHHATRLCLLGKDLAIVESALALDTAEAVVVPFTSESLNILTNHGNLAIHTLWSAALGAPGLAVDAPGVSVLFNVRHAVLKRITTLGTEKMSVVPVLAKCHNVFSKDGCFAVLASWRK